ncbi:DNA alkylation repair protein [Microbacteriaceae bacterium VKM Ac-2855]|nr:DNA alkylation repair protein [Microbacteriaceae bacterium VKM Ac-2855]
MRPAGAPGLGHAILIRSLSQNGRVSEPGDFILRTLQNEGDYWRAEEVRERVGGGLGSTGASVGAVRGTVRDALRKFRGLDHDAVTALASELWREPVFEQRLAAVVLLQSNAQLLRASDLTRLEGFVRSSAARALVEPLARDVIRPLLAGLDPAERGRADAVLTRWLGEPALRRAAEWATD